MSLDIIIIRYCSYVVSRVPSIIRILGVSSPEVLSALELLSRETKKHNSDEQAQRGEEAQDSEVQIAIIQALAPLQTTSLFEGIISKTNDSNQTLAHFAVLSGYIDLLRQLVEWNIDLSIADVDGLTALHCAYKKGDRAAVELLLGNGASETVLDVLGRAPSHLMPEGFDSPRDYDTDAASNDQTESEQMLDTLSLHQNTDYWHGASGSDDEKSVNEDERVCQERSDQTDAIYPVASTSKVRVRGLINQIQWEGGVRIQKMRRIRNVQTDVDVNSLIPELRERLVDPEAIEYLCKEVFPTGKVSLPALQAPMCQSDRAESDETTQKYHGLLLKIEKISYKCRLCPRDNELSFDDDKEALHHITKSHLGMRTGVNMGGMTILLTRWSRNKCSLTLR